MLTSLEPFISVQEEENVQKEEKKNEEEKQNSYSVSLNMQCPLLPLKYYRKIPFTFHTETYKKNLFLF